MLAKYFDLKTWTSRRWLYLGLGVFLVIMAVVEREGLGALIGAYFMIMAIFNVGCASGCCSNGNCETDYSKYKEKQ
jgi:hypothetical protein